jgi:hypothetical protein
MPPAAPPKKSIGPGVVRLVAGEKAMARAIGTIGTALILGTFAGVATADARPAGGHPPTGTAPPATTNRPVQWKLWIGKKAYAASPRGGSLPLSRGSDWQCRYSATRETHQRNLKEEIITLTCSAGSAEFSMSASCSYPVDPHKQVEEGVMPSELQHAILGGRTYVGLSCDVPGYELRTYRKK